MSIYEVEAIKEQRSEKQDDEEERQDKLKLEAEEIENLKFAEKKNLKIKMNTNLCKKTKNIQEAGSI